MTIPETSQCVGCAHFDRETRTVNRCEAFPDGIPDDVYRNRVDHRTAIEGDRGVRWKPFMEGFVHPIARRGIRPANIEKVDLPVFGDVL